MAAKTLARIGANELRRRRQARSIARAKPIHRKATRNNPFSYKAEKFSFMGQPAWRVQVFEAGEFVTGKTLKSRREAVSFGAGEIKRWKRIAAKRGL